MLFVCVLAIRVTYMEVISEVIPFIPELLPSEARVLQGCLPRTLHNWFLADEEQNTDK